MLGKNYSVIVMRKHFPDVYTPADVGRLLFHQNPVSLKSNSHTWKSIMFSSTADVFRHLQPFKLRIVWS